MVLLGRLIMAMKRSFKKYIFIVAIIIVSVNEVKCLDNDYLETSELNLKFVDKLVHSPKDFYAIINNSREEFKIFVDSSLFHSKINFLHSMAEDFSKIEFEYVGTCIYQKYNEETNDSITVQKVLYEEKYEFDEEIKDWWNFWYAGCKLTFCCHDNFFVTEFIWKNNSWHLHYYVLYECIDSYLVLYIGNNNVP
jgi:uncharacterized protein YkuJ